MGNSVNKSSNFAYRVIHISENSPAADVGLHPFLDFIIPPESEDENMLFSEIVKQHEDKELPLNIYNVITRDTRSLVIVPNKNWGEKKSLLGAIIRYENYTDAHMNVVRIMEITPASPAHQAGLIPFNDFVLGTKAKSFESIQDFSNCVEDKKSLTLFVYNKHTDVIREVTILPDKEWGGNGMLGCDIAFGVLNQLPYKQHKESQPIKTKESESPHVKEESPEEAEKVEAIELTNKESLDEKQEESPNEKINPSPNERKSPSPNEKRSASPSPKQDPSPNNMQSEKAEFEPNTTRSVDSIAINTLLERKINLEKSKSMEKKKSRKFFLLPTNENIWN